MAHNQQFLADWFTKNTAESIKYDPNSIQVQDMMTSLNVERWRNKYYAAGAPIEGQEFDYGTFKAFWETIVNPFTAN